MNTRMLKGRIRALGLTQGVLAEKIGISQQSLSHKLHNKRPTTLKEAALIARELKLNAKEIKTYLFDNE